MRPKKVRTAMAETLGLSSKQSDEFVEMVKWK
jgi:hypothetical protein